MTDDQKWDHILSIIGACVPLISAVASLINHIIRKKIEAGEKVSPILTGTGSVLNIGAVNIDKAVQLAKLARSSGLLAAAAVATPEVTQAVAAKVEEAQKADETKPAEVVKP